MTVQNFKSVVFNLKAKLCFYDNAEKFAAILMHTSSSKSSMPFPFKVVLYGT